MDPQLATLVDECVSALGFDLEAIELTPAGNKRVLRIAVDRDGGVGIDHITEATRALSEELDASDVMGSQPYTLEVTSQGVDRPLTHPRHWRRNAGRLVRLRLADDSSIDGRIGESDDEGVVIEGRTASQRLAYSIMASTYPNRHYQLAAQNGGQKSNVFPTRPERLPVGDDLDRALARGLRVGYYVSDLPVPALYGQRG